MTTMSIHMMTYDTVPLDPLKATVFTDAWATGSSPSLCAANHLCLRSGDCCWSEPTPSNLGAMPSSVWLVGGEGETGGEKLGAEDSGCASCSCCVPVAASVCALAALTSASDWKREGRGGGKRLIQHTGQWSYYSECSYVLVVPMYW